MPAFDLPFLGRSVGTFSYGIGFTGGGVHLGFSWLSLGQEAATAVIDLTRPLFAQPVYYVQPGAAGPAEADQEALAQGGSPGYAVQQAGYEAEAASGAAALSDAMMESAAATSMLGAIGSDAPLLSLGPTTYFDALLSPPAPYQPNLFPSDGSNAVPILSQMPKMRDLGTDASGGFQVYQDLDSGKILGIGINGPIHGYGRMDSLGNFVPYKAVDAGSEGSAAGLLISGGASLFGGEFIGPALNAVAGRLGPLIEGIAGRLAGVVEEGSGAMEAAVEAGGSTTANAAAATQSADRQALNSLIKEATNGGRTPLDVEDANTILGWAEEQKIPGVRAGKGDVNVPSNWNARPDQPHIHIPNTGVGNHIPVKPGLPPRTP